MKLTLLPIKKKNSGFSLVELLIAVVILGGISILGVNLLWDSLATRAKQYSIESSSDNFRLVLSILTEAIQSAEDVKIPNPSLIEITGSPCRTIKLNPTTKAIEQSIDNLPICHPPTGGFVRMTHDEIILQTLEFFSEGTPIQIVKINIKGIYKDSLGEHPFSYYTSVVPRTVL